MTTEKMLFYLEEYYPKCSFTYQGDDKIDINDTIKLIDNRQGKWFFLFYSVPPVDLIISILYLFSNKFSENTLSVNFNTNKLTDIVFLDIYKNGRGINLSKLFAYYETN